MTSGKKSKDERKRQQEELRADLHAQLKAAKESQETKLSQSQDHLVAQLRVASDKYLTVNGYMQARSTFEQVTFGDYNGMTNEEISDLCCQLSCDMAKVAERLADAIDKTHFSDIDDHLLDDMINTRFAYDDFTVAEAVQELLIANLLQNVGPSINDIVSFRESTLEGILKLEEELAKYDEPKLSVVE